MCIDTDEQLVAVPPMSTHNWLFSEPSTFESTATNLQSDGKRFALLHVMTHSGGVGKWITVCFLLR